MTLKDNFLEEFFNIILPSIATNAGNHGWHLSIGYVQCMANHYKDNA